MWLFLLFAVFYRTAHSLSLSLPGFNDRVRCLSDDSVGEDLIEQPEDLEHRLNDGVCDLDRRVVGFGLAAFDVGDVRVLLKREGVHIHELIVVVRHVVLVKGDEARAAADVFENDRFFQHVYA